MYVTSGGLVGINTNNPNANLDVYGTISATNFVGDGSGLSGVVAGATDRIVSGTNAATRMVAISSTGYISITQAGANSGWFSPYTGLVTLGVSATGPISGTNGYFSGPVGIGTFPTTNMLTVNGASAFYPLGMTAAASLILQGDTYQGISDVIRFRQGTAAGGGIAFTFFDEPYPPLFLKRNTPSKVSVGIGTATPTATLDVRGTVSASDAVQLGSSSLACSAGIAGALRYASGNIQFCNGVSWGNLVGAADAMGDRIVSGSTNAIAHQDRSLTISTAGSQRMVVGENGNVGMGTSAPAAALHISGSGYPLLRLERIGSHPALELSNGTSTTGIYFRTTGVSRFGINVPGAGDAFVIETPSGNVGISKTLPLAKLDVAGTISASDAIQVGTSTLTCGAGIPGAIRYSGSALQYCNGASWTTLGTSAGVTGTGSATAVAFWGSANGLTYSDGFYWNDVSKRLGIGTNLPDWPLHISTTFPIVKLDRAASGASNGGLFWSENGSDRWKVVSYNGAFAQNDLRNAIAFLQAADRNGNPLNLYRLTINDSGNVGINTASQTATLQVSGSFIVSSTDTGISPSLYVSTSGRVGIRTMSPQGHLHIATDDATSSLYLSRAGDLTSAISFESSLGNSLVAGGGSAGNLRFFSAGAQRMVLSAAGNVGIGAALLPAVSLSVVGEVQVSNSGVACSATARGAIRYTQSGGVLSYCNGTIWTTLGAAGGGQEDRIVSGTTNAIAWQDRSLTITTAGTQQMIVGENGRVGIGTDTPLAKVHIINDGNGAVWVTSANGANYSTLNFGVNTTSGLTWFNSTGVGTGSVNPIGFGLGGSERFRISSASISTTVPLIVSGTISASDAIQVGTSTLACGAGVPGAIRYNGGLLQYCNGTSWTTLGTSAGVTGTGSATAVAFWNGSNALTYDDGFYYNPTSNFLGVGTNLPQAPLHISSTGGNNSALVLTDSDAAANRKHARFYNNNGKFFLDVPNDAYAGVTLVPMVVDLGTGNVGVGIMTGAMATATPTATLQVSGSFIVSTTGQNTTPTLWVGVDSNVGMGTSSPMATLDIRGANTTKLNYTDGDSLGAGLVLRDTLPNSQSGGQILFGSQQGLYAGIKGELRSGSGPAGNINFQTRSTTGNIYRRMVVFYDGKVGIGVSDTTNVIATTLLVSGTFAVSNSGLDGTGAALFVGTNNRVGIGTSAPTASLTVVGEAQVGSSGAACVTSTNAGAIRYLGGTLYYCNASNTWTALGTSSGVTGTGSATAVAFWSGPSALSYSDGFYWDDTNKRLGVGTNVPSQSIHVVGQLRIDRDRNQLALHSASGVAMASLEGIVDASTGGALIFNPKNIAGSFTERARIDSAGNFGIATQSPTATLQVSGTFTVSTSAQNAASPSFYIDGNGRVGVGTNAPGTVFSVESAIDHSGSTANTSSYPFRVGQTGSGSVLMGRYGGQPAIQGAGSGTSYRLLLNPGNGNVGISKTVPLAKLDVNGTISASDAIQLGQNTIACGTQVSGSIRYNTVSNTVQFCNGTAWTSLASGTTGASALSVLSDVELTNLAGRDYLRYDNATSKWVNISESVVMSTTTMVPNWPDAILCTSSGNIINMVINSVAMPGGSVSYRYSQNPASANDYLITFASNGYYSSHSNMASFDCIGKSIATLYSEGKAFNFIGNAATSGGALGDRITSGTLAMTANSDTGIVSLSINGTVWGYLGNAASYLPTITANRVSATNISGTLIQVADNGAACSSGMSGSVRFSTVSDTLQVCTGNGWKSLVSSTAVALGAAECRVCITETTNDANTSCSAYSSMDALQETVDAYYANNGGNGASNVFSSFKIGLQCRGGIISGSSALGDRITSGTLPYAMTLNSATGIVSLSSAATTWGYLGSVASYLPTFSSTNISASSAIQVGSNSLTCNSGISGTLRYSQVSSTMEYCNSTAWVSMGSSATDAISFRAQNASTQTVAVSTYEKMLLGNENFDTNNNFASGRFTATVPGTYYFSAIVACKTTTGGCNGQLYVNGSAVLTGSFSSSANDNNSTVSGLLRLNIGDYVELWGRNAGATTMSTGTYLQGFLVGPQAGGGGGASALSGLSDVNTSGATTGSIIAYNGSNWVVSSTAAAGMSALASLTDVTLTNLAGRDYLRYDNATSKWVNISESAVMSTTTMVDGWPDAIRCTSATYGELVFYHSILDTPGSGYRHYRFLQNPTSSLDFNIAFNAASKAYASHVNGSTFDCVSNAWSISQLYAQGRAFNFIGNANGSGTALGDRITSGTLAMVANSDTSYVSLSTAGTTWGYFGNAGSFLPAVTANKVSSTNVSATYLQLSSPTTVLSCNAGLTGSMRYTSGTMQVCDGSNWGNIGLGVPTGTIAAFAASSCPNGWAEYTAARGRFLRGIDNGAGIDPAGTRAAGNQQADAMQQITGSVGFNRTAGSIFSGAFATAAQGSAGASPGSSAAGGLSFDSANSPGARTSTETRPSNVAVTFCVYAGFQSAPGQTILTTLASLTDVSIAGATTGQVLAYNGASWVPSTTSGGGGNALGDRITSGTHAVTANTNSGYVSLSTNGTDWGYLSGGISYLPNITASKVSATNISATYIQLNSPTTVLTCNAGLTGSMRYTSGTMQVCDGSNWGNIGIGVPTGTISAFQATSCPAGWSEYQAARGRFLRGYDNNAGVDPDGNRTPGATQNDAFQGHFHTIDGGGSNIAWRASGGNGAYPGGTNLIGAGVGNPITDGTNGTPRVDAETRPKNVAVIFCTYQGFQSAPGQTILTTLASLTDVSVAGVTTGQVLTYSGGTWIASNTTGGGGSTPAGGAGDIQFNNGSALAADTGQLYWDATNNRLGVGTSAPVTSLEVKGTFLVSASTTPTSAPSLYINSAGLVGIGSAPSSNVGVYINSVTTAGTAVYGLRTNLSIEPVTAPAASQAYRGQYTYAAYNSAQTAANGTIRGGEFYSYKTGTGSVSATYGVMAYSSARGGGGLSTSVWGLYGFANVSDSASTGNAYGTAGLTYDYTGAGSGGGITNAYSFYAAGSSAAGNIANYYGLYISNFGGIDPSGSFFGVYVADPAMSNYFGGNIGIGVLAPNAKLDVAGTISASDAIQVGASSLTCGAGIPGALRYNSGNMEFCNGSTWISMAGAATSAVSSTGAIQFNANGSSFGGDTANLFWNNATKRLGIGTATPSYPLDVNGVVQATSFFQSSDRTLKDNIVQLESGLATIERLKPVTFDWKKDGKHAVGLIAQDVMKVIPTAVTSNTEGVYAVDYTQTIPFLIKGMQELKADNDNELRNLKSDNDVLKAEIAKLLRDNQAIMKRLDALERRTGTRGR